MGHARAPRAPRLIAHRGYTLHFPENTLLALEAAVSAGARFVEIDIQLSRDCVPMLYHDRTLKRLCGIQGAIHDRTLAKLKRLHPADKARFGRRYRDIEIATLAEFCNWLKLYPTVTAFVELKRVALEHFGIDTVLTRAWRELASVAKQCIVISYSLPALAMARRLGWPKLGVVVDDWTARRHALMREIEPEYLFCAKEGLPRSGRLQYKDAKIAVFEVDDADLARRLARRGVSFVETFAIGEMRAELQQAKSI